MITIRTVADITADRQVIVNLPLETPLGRAEVVITVAGGESASLQDGALQDGALRRRFGAVHGGDAQAADNERIDADLLRSYENPG